MAQKKKVIAVAITTVALTAGSLGIAGAADTATATNPKSTVLSDLVSKGTITQAQADAINTAFTAAHANRPMGSKGPKGGGAFGVDKLAVTATALGIDSATVQSRLAAGESLATIAGAKKDALIAALVAAETKAIDAAVTAGTLTAANATTLKADLVAHVTAEVNGTLPGGMMGGKGPQGPKGGKGGRGGHGHGHGAMGGATTTGATTGGIPSNG